MTMLDSPADLFDDAGSPCCDRRLEAAYGARWGGPVAGIDEAGRGPLAGPVVTAAVVLTDEPLPDDIADSKTLDARTRERLFAVICRDHLVAVASASPQRIDAMNIRAATLWAMTRACAHLPLRPAGVLVDGRDVPAEILVRGIRGAAIVKGDARAAAIAAASIVAKVTRDRMMTALAPRHPLYGFDRHMGYGTPEHLRALSLHGPCPLHRRSFAPVRAAQSPPPS